MEILQKNVTLGFASADDENDYDKTKAKIIEEAKKMFKPEFLNRLDDMVIFRKLEKKHIFTIVDLELEKLRERIRSRGYRIRISKQVKEFLVEEGYDDKLGARPLRRAVERHIEDTLAEAILNEEITSSECKILIAKLKNKEIYFEPMNETPTPVLIEKTNESDDKQ